MKKVKYELDHQVGDIVYLITDPAQYKRVVVGILMGWEPQVTYMVRLGDYEPTQHLSCELSENVTPDVMREPPEEE